jgi:integrase
MRVSGGSVYLRGKTWTIGYTVGGRRVRESVGSNKKLAEMVLKKRVTEAIENKWFDRRADGNLPFDAFATTYLERCIPLLKSVKSERVRVLTWVREFGKRPLGQITRAELQDWQARKLQTCKPATVNRIMCRLRHMFNRAVEWELLDESPMDRLKFIRENNARLRYLSIEECKRLLEACLSPHMRAIVTIAMHTGMRMGEILSLKWPDVDPATGLLTIRDSKNGESRHIAMDSTVRDVLDRFPRALNSDYIFANANGGRFTWIQKGFRNARARAGLGDLHFHDLRHTFASQWMMNGGDLYALKEILGHKSVAMTQRYAHLSPAYKRAMVDRMEQIWIKPEQGMAGAEPSKVGFQNSARHALVTKELSAVAS